MMPTAGVLMPPRAVHNALWLRTGVSGGRERALNQLLVSAVCRNRVDTVGVVVETVVETVVNL